MPEKNLTNRDHDVAIFDQGPSNLLKGHANGGFYDPQLSAEAAQQNANKCKEPKKVIKMSKLRILKNLLVLSFGFLLLFTAYKCLVNLQSSINHTLGTMSLSAVYVAFAISCMFLPSLTINLLGLKRTLAISTAIYILYFMANFYPQWYTLMPVSILAGLAAGPLWTAEGSYITILAGEYAERISQPMEACLGRVIGVFYLIYLTCHVWGNLISYYVLKPLDFDTLENNSDLSACGPAFCNKWSNTTQLERMPTPEQFYMLHGIYTGCTVMAALILFIFLDPLEDNADVRKPRTPFLQSLITPLKHVLSNYYQMLLIPLTLYSGLEQAYIAGDFTKAFVSCGWGVYHVGYVMICYGVADSVASFALGALLKLLGRTVIILFGAAINLAMIALMFWWQPTEDNHILYFVIAGLWGVGDAVWQTTINAVYGVLFYNCKVAAFANLRLWKSVGFMLAFAYSSFLCIQIKLWLLTGTLVIGVIAYVAIEVHLRLTKDKTSDLNSSTKTEETSIK